MTMLVRKTLILKPTVMSGQLAVTSASAEIGAPMQRSLFAPIGAVTA